MQPGTASWALAAREPRLCPPAQSVLEDPVARPAPPSPPSGSQRLRDPHPPAPSPRARARGPHPSAEPPTCSPGALGAAPGRRLPSGGEFQAGPAPSERHPGRPSRCTAGAPAQPHRLLPPAGARPSRGPLQGLASPSGVQAADSHLRRAPGAGGRAEGKGAGLRCTPSLQRAEPAAARRAAGELRAGRGDSEPVGRLSHLDGGAPGTSPHLPVPPAGLSARAGPKGARSPGALGRAAVWAGRDLPPWPGAPLLRRAPPCTLGCPHEKCSGRSGRFRAACSSVAWQL